MIIYHLQNESNRSDNIDDTVCKILPNNISNISNSSNNTNNTITSKYQYKIPYLNPFNPSALRQDSMSQLTTDERDDMPTSTQSHPMREVQGDERRIEGAESDT